MLLPLALSLLCAPAEAMEIPFETYTLPNGMNVILHEDHSLPTVVVDIIVRVGSKDEVEGRSGFAHLFEHLMFMGTDRLPGSDFDSTMEAHGGWNNAWTSEDATNYYDVGPTNLLPLLLWMEADRWQALDEAMTSKKVDLQRDVVRNERRQSVEDTPYGILWEALPGALFPKGHPYAHSVIGTHEDLKAASLQDVVGFFQTWYVPNNASLVVAGDFSSAEVKPLIEKYFGLLERRELPARNEPPQPDKAMVPLTELSDEVQVPMTTLAWHSPRRFAPGDAEMDLLAGVLTGGRSSRLYRSLVEEKGVALEVEAFQSSQHLGSVFLIMAKPAEGHTVAELEGLIQAELEKLAKEGPTEAELSRIKNQTEMGFMHGLEALQDRATQLNLYWYSTGKADYTAQDLDRYRKATTEGLKSAAASLSAERRAIVRVNPAPAAKGQ
jgi:zinc protease